jgi:secreted Zn-dependent insulinase-like peptidase
MWLLSFDDAILDLAELGATAGIAYESSFNKAGLRLSFRGVSQSLPSYVRRFCRRLVQHHVKLLDGSARVSDAVYKRAAFGDSQSLKPNRMGTNRVANQVSERDVANQGLLFLKCTHCKSME